jgi:hypothetical protein
MVTTEPALSHTMTDTVGLRGARRLALDLTRIVRRRNCVVVLANPLDGTELARVCVGGAPLVDGDALLALVMSSEPAVCVTARLHDASLHRLGVAWHAERLLVVPCFFGHDLVALAIAPIDKPVESRQAEIAARAVAERFAAHVVGTRLFAAGRRADALLATG